MDRLKLAIVGSRKFPNLSMVESYVKYGIIKEGICHKPVQDVEIVSGGAPGVDQKAETTARMLHYEVEVFEAEWDKYGKGAGFKRNTLIVNYADLVTAFWDGQSPGTTDTIRKAVKANKLLNLFVRNDYIYSCTTKLPSLVSEGS